MKKHVLALAIAGVVAVPAFAAVSDLQVIIRNTDPLVGLSAGTWATLGTSTFAASGPFQTPTIDSAGRVLFRASLTTDAGAGITTANNTLSIYNSAMVARTGSAALGVPTLTMTGFGAVTQPLSPNGKMWMGGNTTPTGGFVSVGTPGNFTMVTRGGDTTLPGVGGVALGNNPNSTSNFSNVNNAGQTFIQGSLVGGGFGAWVGAPGGLELVVSSSTVGTGFNGLPAGQPVVGTSVATTLNGSGNMSIGLRMTGTNAVNNDLLLIRNFGNTNFIKLGQEGNSAPGTVGASFAQMTTSNPQFFPENSPFSTNNTAFNNSNHLVFGATLQNGDVVANVNDAALYAYNGASTSLFRRRGDASTAVAGAVYNITQNSANEIRLNNADTIAWTASLVQGTGGVTANNDAVLLRTSLGSSTDTLLAREGQSISLVPGALWGSFSSLLQNNAGPRSFPV